MIVAIPTIYNSVRFRSRLEARWAAFFDLLQMKWSYEPMDFKGWIPDFFLHDHHQYTEVKPIDEYCLQTAKKMLTAAPDETLVLLGLAPKFTDGLCYVGWWVNGGEAGSPATLTTYCGDYEIFYDGFSNSPKVNTRLVAEWKKAGNATQWKGR